MDDLSKSSIYRANPGPRLTLVHAHRGDAVPAMRISEDSALLDRREQSTARRRPRLDAGQIRQLPSAIPDALDFDIHTIQ
jgi:hypothetical protein